MALSETERRACGLVDALADELAGLAARIAAEPELGYQEHAASAAVAEVVRGHGHECEVGIAGMPTALRARAGSGGPRLAILAEYDALPGLGHGCGHNVIASAATGAFLALAEGGAGTVELIGCPAEESTVDGAGGKIRLLDAGVFDGFDASLMIHPYDQHAVIADGGFAARGARFTFLGRPAHAAMSPEEGVNALDAAVLAYSAIGLMRQQLPSSARVHGIFTEGGEAPNIIPERASLRFRFRGPDAAVATDAYERGVACARGAAASTGCELEIDEFMPMYLEMRQDPRLRELALGALDDLGLAPSGEGEGPSFGSSDFGNVSHVVPAVEIGIALAPPGVRPHTVGFAEAAASAAARRAVVDGAKALAVTAIRSR